jgi:hypothetical protein
MAIEPGTRPDAARERREAFVNSGHQRMGGVGPFLILVNGRYRLFEFHGVCGPILVRDDGEPLKKQPGARSDFWPAFDAWRKAGCHVVRHNRAFVPSMRVLGE